MTVAAGVQWRGRSSSTRLAPSHSHLSLLPFRLRVEAQHAIQLLEPVSKRRHDASLVHGFQSPVSETLGKKIDDCRALLYSLEGEEKARLKGLCSAVRDFATVRSDLIFRSSSSLSAYERPFAPLRQAAGPCGRWPRARRTCASAARDLQLAARAPRRGCRRALACPVKNSTALCSRSGSRIKATMSLYYADRRHPRPARRAFIDCLLDRDEVAPKGRKRT